MTGKKLRANNSNVLVHMCVGILLYVSAYFVTTKAVLVPTTRV
jgi:hypothetical protein